MYLLANRLKIFKGLLSDKHWLGLTLEIIVEIVRGLLNQTFETDSLSTI